MGTDIFALPSQAEYNKPLDYGTMPKPRVIWFLVAVLLCVQPIVAGMVQSAPAAVKVKELNFVFSHGAAGTGCGTQLLSDLILERIPAYTRIYQLANPGVKVRVNVLNRCYPNDVDAETWARSIAESVNRFLPAKRNMIIVGHSMGGKAALYGLAHNVDGLADKTALVVTINTPVKPLAQYQIAGGGSSVEYCRARWLRSDRGVCESAAYYDSSEDGTWVGQNRHWLAFVSAESAPLSTQCDFGGIDTYPREMDDAVVPLSAQYADGADVIYYGQYYHSDFHTLREPAGLIADGILTYIFGGIINCPVLAGEGSLEHRAAGFLGADYWQDIVGDVLGISGAVQHKNESVFLWQEWEDIVEYVPPTYEGARRTKFEASLAQSSSPFARIEEVRWLEPDNPEDFRLYLRTRAAPRQSLRVDWSIYRQYLLPEGQQRSHFEVRVVAGTPLTAVYKASWATDDLRELGIVVFSKAERPFRWFRAEWKVFQEESRYRKLIDEIPSVFE
ncbi:MAG: hypothetical protein FJ008_03265 [Chloroflexi bacterium]|nr:hypothetical protein [Chloroflexota bacterium]MBM3173448.1 hypothetical protein [Chloroflexota bacterium]MBM3174457.1 hypothetical protein [Chloroflexota bacterium]